MDCHLKKKIMDQESGFLGVFASYLKTFSFDHDRLEAQVRAELPPEIFFPPILAGLKSLEMEYHGVESWYKDFRSQEMKPDLISNFRDINRPHKTSG